MIGEPDDFVEESPEGNEVLSVLACTKGASLSPAEVAKKVGITVKACQMRLTRLAKSGQIIKVGHGKYIHVNYNVTRNTA